ncbi:MAG: peptidase M29 [Pseudomonadota bacterium]
MLSDRIEAKWIDAFEATFQACKVTTDETAILLSETQSRDLNVNLAELALARMGVTFFHLKVPTPRAKAPAILRSTGMSLALDGQAKAVEALQSADFIVDLTLEGLMHARQTGAILGSGARVLNISNEHPEMLERALPDEDLKARCLAAARICRGAELMRVRSAAGTDLTVAMTGNNTVGVWGWTDKPGTLAHWPGGIVVSFPAAGSVNGRLVFQPGDMNLTFKRYFESEVIFDIREDYVTAVKGNGTDARLMRAYYEAFGQKEAYATSHVGWGLNTAARQEALAMYGRRDLNGTELRAVAGNFLYSTGANEFAGRFTEGHFDLPMMGCTISIDGQVVVDEGALVE